MVGAGDEMEPQQEQQGAVSASSSKMHFLEEDLPSSLTTTPSRVGRAPVTRRSAARLPHSPYPKSSPRTPVAGRGIAADKSLIAAAEATTPSQQQQLPQSPAMKAVSGLLGLLSPFGSGRRKAKRSAAFGTEEEDDAASGLQDKSMDATSSPLAQSHAPPRLLEQDDQHKERQHTTLYPQLPEVAPNPPLLLENSAAARSSLYSPRPPTTFQEARQGTPSRTGFGALARQARAAGVFGGTTPTAIPAPPPAYTFGSGAAADATGSKDQGSSSGNNITSTTLDLSSPLGRNYDLLSRFFAEKAQEEAIAARRRTRDAAPSSSMLRDYNNEEEVGGEEEGHGAEAGLSEIEVAGCMRLIEQSLAEGRAHEVERLRSEAITRGMADGSLDFSEQPQPGFDLRSSRSPSLPLGAAAGEETPFGFGTRSTLALARHAPSSSSIFGGSMKNNSARYGQAMQPVSQSFLAPSFSSPSLHQRHHHQQHHHQASTVDEAGDQAVQRSLAHAFAPPSLRTSSSMSSGLSTSGRRHRPLYLGPGMGASNSTTLLRRRNEQAQRRAAVAAQRRALHQPASAATMLTPPSSQEGAGEPDEEVTGKRRRLGGDAMDTDDKEESNRPTLFSAEAETSMRREKPMETSSMTPKSTSKSTATSMTPSRSATADAMLSILSSGPQRPSLPRASLASPSSSSRPFASPSASTPTGSLAGAEFINPYQPVASTPLGRGTRRSTRESTAASAASSSSASPSLTNTREKERQRLKEEREKRLQRQQEKKAVPKETTLDLLERTAPSRRTRSRRETSGIRLEEESEEDDESGKGEALEAAKTKEAAKAKEEEEQRRQKEEEEAQKLAEEARKRKQKTDEIKKRMDELANQKKNNQQQQQPQQQAQQSRKSMSFSPAFAPKKPSPLSQAATRAAPDSPGASSTSSESDREMAISPQKPAPASAPAPTLTTSSMSTGGLFSFGQTASISSEKKDTSLAGSSSTSSPFSFTKPAADTTFSAPATAMDKNAPKPSAPFSFGGTSTTQASDKPASSPFSFGAPSGSQTSTADPNPIPASASVTASKADSAASGQPKTTAMSTATAALPKFDFALQLVLPSTSKNKADEAARGAALQTAEATLPRFAFGTDAAHAPAPSESTSTDSAPKTTGATLTPVFNFGGVNQSSASSSADTSKATSEAASPAPSSVAPADEQQGSVDGEGSSGGGTSGLLSGQGEGEEDEETVHTVRGKLWKLASGQWSDLGIGQIKVKKHLTNSTKRLLVRSEGNGRVTVNFRLLPSFKPQREKNVLTFLGFDEQGQPTNFRCKVKTDDWAEELTEALLKQAKA